MSKCLHCRRVCPTAGMHAPCLHFRFFAYSCNFSISIALHAEIANHSSLLESLHAFSRSFAFRSSMGLPRRPSASPRPRRATPHRRTGPQCVSPTYHGTRVRSHGQVASVESHQSDRLLRCAAAPCVPSVACAYLCCSRSVASHTPQSHNVAVCRLEISRDRGPCRGHGLGPVPCSAPPRSPSRWALRFPRLTACRLVLP